MDNIKYIELPPYIDIVDKNHIKVRLDGGWQGQKTVTMTRNKLQKAINDLGYGIRTASVIQIDGLAFDWRNARGLIEELCYIFEELDKSDVCFV